MNSTALLFHLETKIQRKPQVSRSHSIGESIRSKHGRILIRHTTQLHIGTSLLITSLQIKVGIRNTVCNTHIPRRRLSIQLHLQLLNHLLLRLQKGHGGLLLLSALQLHLHCFLTRLGNAVHDRLQIGSFRRILPVRSLPCRILCTPRKETISLQHGFVLGCARCLGSRPVRLECLLSQERQLTQVQDMKRGIDGSLEFFDLAIVD